MLSAEESKRYSRHLLMSTIGELGQKKLKTSKVFVIGAGGLGCPILQYITAAGVGKIGIIDYDVVDESNLQRQILYNVDDIGINKAVAAKKRLQGLNPLIDIVAYQYKLDNENALELFEQYDIIVDGSDNFSTRYLVNDACILSNKPLVYGAIFQFDGQVSVFNYEDGPSYRCLFPDPPKEGSVPNCSEVGVLGVLPGMIGTTQANEVLKIILGLGSVLSGTLMLIDALENTQLKVAIEKDQDQIDRVLSNRKGFKNYDYNLFCGLTNDEKDASVISEGEISILALEDILKKEDVLLIDVREEWEIPTIKKWNPLNIPLNTLKENLVKIDKQKKKVVFCQSGGRSAKAIAYLQEQGFNNLINLTGGVGSYSPSDY
jgi:molybdopterin/thiamine biosynthesis adenylyltransferase/rhodanese-related sulfurtransferase